MMHTRLVWATPNADDLLAFIARVSNPQNQRNPSIEGLLKYMAREGHNSPFEMCHACLEVNTTRDIARQILRHRSFSFQEFSQRYAEVDELSMPTYRTARLQDEKNRQNSLETNDPALHEWWATAQGMVDKVSFSTYKEALRRGIAKEVARTVLPEGLTPSRLYMVGSFRSWIHYLQQRLHPSTQKEHREVAQDALAELRLVAPVTFGTFFPNEDNAAD
jgi:thymidylate synthase (FAD)